MTPLTEFKPKPFWWRHFRPITQDDHGTANTAFYASHAPQTFVKGIKHTASYHRPCFHYWYSVQGNCKWSDTLWPVGRVRLFADYTISLSSLCRPIWRHWTTKMLVRYMLPSVYLRLRQFSQLSFVQYMGLCVFSLPNSPVMIVRMCTLSYYHHQTGSMDH